MATIGNVAEQLGIGVSTLRTWEREGLIPRPDRRRTGWRNYTAQDVIAIKEVLEKRHGKGEV